jgi:hypothetical protein
MITLETLLILYTIIGWYVHYKMYKHFRMYDEDLTFWKFLLVITSTATVIILTCLIIKYCP